MLRGDNRTEDKTDNKIEKDMDKVQKAFDDVQMLKEKIEQMKEQSEQITAVNQKEKKDTVPFDEIREKFSDLPDKETIAAAERAVMEHARKEAEEGIEVARRREQVREEKVQEARRIEQETKDRLVVKKREADEKQKQLEEAEKRAAAVRLNQQKMAMRSEKNHNIRDRELKEAIRKKEEEEKRLHDIEDRINREKALAEAKAIELEQREREKLAKLKEKERKEEERRAREAEKAAREAEKEAKKRALLEKKAEEVRIREEENRRKADREALIAEQRAIQRKKREEEKAELRRIKEEERAELRKKKEEERAEQKRVKKEKEVRRNEEKAARKNKLREERLQKAELRKQRRIARKSAEIGGGIVNVHGTIIQTEIKPVATYSVKDLLGMSKRKEIKATTSEEEKQALQEENRRIQQEARASAVQLAEVRRLQRGDSGAYEKIKAFLAFCDEKKKGLLIAVSVVLAFAVGMAAVFNYCTAYEYSYNGQFLGYVKNKDDVLHITNLVQTALTEEKDVDIVIDARDDIEFKRVYTFNKDITTDSSDQVLKRLTYVGDLNVKAYGIYVDGNKIGAVADKESAASVFEGIKAVYASNEEGSEIKKAVIVEKVDVKKANASFKDVMSVDEMVAKLCTDGIRTTTHTVARGDTIKSIARLYNVSEEQILKDNDIQDPEKLTVGSSVVINETAPIITVRITEERSYVEKTSYKTIKKKDKDLYEGYTEVDQKGQEGVSQIKNRTVSVNGEVVSTKILKETVQKEPVEKIVRIGTKERPPTVGSGTYIWPANPGTYTVTSEFKWRWGRQHEGIDMGCSTGTDVLAADGGTVTYAGWMGGYGNLVIIDHQNGIETYYGHNSSLVVSKGDKVFQGQHIAEAGNTGHSFGSHIHFGVKDHGVFKNPRNYLP